jgi:hypothetical protein
MTRTKRGLIGAVAIAALCAPAPATAAKKRGSKVTLASSFPAFHGKVKSKSDACIAERKVRLYSERPGKDALLGKARTNARGRWTIRMEPTPGVYYARVKSTGSCKGDVSRPVVID